MDACQVIFRDARDTAKNQRFWFRESLAHEHQQLAGGGVLPCSFFGACSLAHEIFSASKLPRRIVSQ